MEHPLNLTMNAQCKEQLQVRKFLLAARTQTCQDMYSGPSPNNPDMKCTNFCPQQCNDGELACPGGIDPYSGKNLI